jgi:hypothetical protein
MGNRGGKIHTDDRKLTSRRWASRQWICCVLEFNNRQRDVWGRYYTELFFLDEVTAFAAGHRPCFECRRKDAERFAALFAGTKKRASAPAMDQVLHAERLDGKAKRLHRRKLDTLPDGAIIARGGEAFAVRGRRQATAGRNRVRMASMSTCSRRRRWSRCSKPVTRRSGTRAQTTSPSSLP